MKLHVPGNKLRENHAREERAHFKGSLRATWAKVSAVLREQAERGLHEVKGVSLSMIDTIQQTSISY